MRPFISKHFVAIILFIVLAIIGLLITKNYGISWDEPIQRQIGEVTYNYVFKNDYSIHNYLEKDHGSGFELPLVIMERTLNITDTHYIYLFRHIVTHLFFLIGAFIFYLLCTSLFKNRVIGIIGFLGLVGHPRLYAHSFYNSKDIPFLVAFILCLYSCYWAYKNKNTLSYLLAGIASGYATSIRMMSLLFIAIVLCFLFIDIFRYKANKAKPIVVFTNPLIFLLSSAISVYVFWPMLWVRPLASFVEAYLNMSKFRWENFLLFDGQMILSTNLPWNYLSKYMLITTPEFWAIAGIIGMLIISVHFIFKPLSFFKNDDRKFLLLNVAMYVGTLLTIAILKSVVYDGWRHVFFIYIPFLIIALYIVQLIQERTSNKTIIALYTIPFIFNMGYMMDNCPYQGVYFNNFISHDEDYIKTHYEADYWGTTYKQAFEYLTTNTKGSIKVYNYKMPVENNARYLPQQLRNRIKLVGCEEAEYYITDYRWHPQDYAFPKIVYEIKIQNSRIMSIYKMFDGENSSKKNCEIANQ